VVPAPVAGGVAGGVVSEEGVAPPMVGRGVPAGTPPAAGVAGEPARPGVAEIAEAAGVVDVPAVAGVVVAALMPAGVTGGLGISTRWLSLPPGRLAPNEGRLWSNGLPVEPAPPAGGKDVWVMVGDEFGIRGSGGIVLAGVMVPAAAAAIPLEAGVAAPAVALVAGVAVFAVASGVAGDVLVGLAIGLPPNADGLEYFGWVLLRVVSPQPVRAIPAHTRPIRPTKGFLPIGIPFPCRETTSRPTPDFGLRAFSGRD
jgi:hypothetical protein